MAEAPPSTLVIRTATRADIGAIDALLARSYPRLLKADYPASVLVTAIPALARAQPALITCGSYYVVERDGHIVGAGGWTTRSPGGEGPEAGRANVRHVVTDDRYVRQGIGRALMGHIIAMARQEGIIWLHCLATRTAVPFYTALGFRTLREVTIPIGPARIGFPAIQMRRDL